MKKLLTIILLLLAVLTADAQGKWTVSHREADPMKNQDARDVYIYNASGIGQVVVWDWDKTDFRLIAEKDFFRFTFTRGMKIVLIKVGLYDENGNMEKVQTFELIMEEGNNGRWIATADRYTKGRKYLRNVMKRMKSGNGYVRFLGPLHSKGDFDLKVIPYQPQ